MRSAIAGRAWGARLAQWLALTPPKLVQAQFNVDQQTMAAISAPKDKPIVVGPQRQHTQPLPLPEWPTTTIAVLSTLDGGLHAIPVTAPRGGGGVGLRD